MALIKCPECGKEISSGSKSCVNCGYKIKQKKNKKLIGIIAISVVVIAIIIIVFFVLNNKLTKNEEYVVSSIQNYKSLLKNPNSLQVHEINVVPFEYDGKQTGAIFLDVSGQNGFGGNNRIIVMYAINESDIEFVGSTEYANSSDSSKQLAAALVQNTYDTMLKNNGKKFNISVDKIMKHIN